MHNHKARLLSSARFCLTLAVGGFLLATTSALAATPPSFNEIVTSALRDNGDLAEKRNVLQQSEILGGANNSDARFSPSVSSDSYRGESPYVFGLSDSVGADSKTVSLELRQPIYRSGDERAQRQAQESLLRAEAAALRLIEQETVLPVITAYINAWRDDSRLAMLRKSTSVGSDELTKAQQQAQESRQLLADITGHSIDTLQAPPAPNNLPASLRDALARAESRHPMIVKAQHECAAAEASTRRLRWELEPDIDFNGSLGRTFDSFDDSLTQDSGLFGLTATIPLRGADERKARTAQAREDEKKRRAYIDEQTKVIRRNVINAWDALLAADKKQALAEKKSALAQAALEGRVSPHSVLARASLKDRQRLANKAALEALDGQSQSLLARYRLLAATGQLGGLFSSEPLAPAPAIVAMANDLQNYNLENIEPKAGESDAKEASDWRLNR